MSLLPADQTFVDNFLAAIAPQEAAYRHVGLSYLAGKVGERFVIRQARAFLNTTAPKLKSPHFQSSNVRAGNYSLTELNLTIRGLIDELIGGRIGTPDGDLYFQAADGDHHAASFIPFHPDGLQTQLRFNVLTIMGGQLALIRQPDIDWEIKAASPPYDGLQELANELNLGPLVDTTGRVEIVAYNVAVIDGYLGQVLTSKYALRKVY